MQCYSTRHGNQCILYIVHYGKHQDDQGNTWFDHEGTYPEVTCTYCSRPAVRIFRSRNGVTTEVCEEHFQSETDREARLQS